MEGVERGRTFVTLLAPTAFAIRVQASVLLVIWMLVRSAPLILSDARVRLEEHAHPSHGEFNLTNLRLRLAFVAAVLPAACGSNSPASSPSQSLPATTTSLYFVSRPGEFIGGGQSRTISASDTPINAGVDCYENRIEVKAGTFPQDWSLTLAAPLTTRLVVGTYESAQRYPFQPRGVPGLDFSGDGRGCNTLTGRFVVTEASYLPTGAIDRFRATFEQRCEGTSPGVSGEVQLVSPTYRRVSC